MVEHGSHEHGLITIYGDTEDGQIAKAFSILFSDRSLRVLTPGLPETLLEAAKNSVLTLIILKSPEDRNLHIIRQLKAERFIPGDVVALCMKKEGLKPLDIMGQGYDSVLFAEDIQDRAFKQFIEHKVREGGLRLESQIREIEYRRMCDALSKAPASMIIFDIDKRAVFVSDHYYRAYPRIAPKLIRGLSVYDAFSMMMREEGMPPEDKRYEKLQKFWYSLQGEVVFEANDGTSYRLKAFPLPSKRGTVLIGQNISDEHHREQNLQKNLEKLRGDYAGLQEEKKAIQAVLREAIQLLERHTEKIGQTAQDSEMLQDFLMELKILREMLKDIT